MAPLQHRLQHTLQQHVPEELQQHLPSYFVYMLPRAVLLLLGWAVSYWILTAVSTHLPPAVVYIAGISWMLAGAIGFGYLYRLRRAEFMPRAPAVTEQKPM